MDFEPYKAVLGALIRHFANILVGYLLVYGVTQAQADAVVEATVAIGVSVIVFLAMLAWSYISKKTAFFTTPTEDK